jgi:hypothetical protein
MHEYLHKRIQTKLAGFMDKTTRRMHVPYLSRCRRSIPVHFIKWPEFRAQRSMTHRDTTGYFAQLHDLSCEKFRFFWDTTAFFSSVTLHPPAFFQVTCSSFKCTRTREQWHPPLDDMLSHHYT